MTGDVLNLIKRLQSCYNDCSEHDIANWIYNPITFQISKFQKNLANNVNYHQILWVCNNNQNVLFWFEIGRSGFTTYLALGAFACNHW